MTADTRPCPSCKGETSIQMIDAPTGTDDPLEVTVKGLPVLRCSAGHTHFVTIDFPLKMVEHLMKAEEPQLPAGEKKGLIFKHFHCAECDRELSPKPDHRHVFEVGMAVGDYARFTVELSMPVYKCEGCGKEQLHSLDEIRSHTPAALAKSFEAAGIAREA